MRIDEKRGLEINIRFLKTDILCEMQCRMQMNELLYEVISVVFIISIPDSGLNL